MTITAGLAVRYRPDSWSEYVIEPVADGVKQTELVRHLILDRGIPAMPVTLLAEPDQGTLTRIFCGEVESIVGLYVNEELNALQVLGRLRRVFTSLPLDVWALVEDAATEYRGWSDAVSPEGGRDVPEHPLSHAETCRVLLDEALARLVAAVDAHTAARNTAKAAA
jgi:hypothetical protein